jgi:hypothetical protein
VAGNNVEPTRSDRSQILVIGLIVCGFMYAYGAHMSRVIVFDEIGLHNPVYTYATTGHMTYPMHGHADYMVVHPPTHYLATALFTKLGVPMFTASALPLLLWTIVLVAILVTGPFSAAASAGLMLGYFVAVTTWSEFYTLRPDLHVTTAWFVGLVTLEAARLSGWSPWRLFLGSALMVLAAAVHYWGVASLLGPLCYGAVLLWQRGLRGSVRPLGALIAGGLVVGVPFLLLFVVPLFEPMMQMVRAVQGTGTPADAFARHLASYDAFAQRITSGWFARPIVAALAAPILEGRVPAVFVACPLLCLWRETRLLGAVGSLLPLFVLFGSQGKQVGYTGYFSPEFALYFAAVLILAFKCVCRLRPAPVSRTWWQAGAFAVAAGFAFTAVPTSMGNGRSWTDRLDALDVIRAASKRVIGDKAAVAVTSAGVWYTGGASYLWNGFNEIILANRSHADVRGYFRPFDGIVIDTNWWNAHPSLAPTATWFMQGQLTLKGFVLPTEPTTRHMMHLFVTAAERTPVVGYFVDRGQIREFREAPGGDTAFAVMRCNALPSTAFNRAWYQFSFAYDRQPAPNAPVLLLLASPAGAAESLLGEAGVGCYAFDRRKGTLRTIRRNGFADVLRDEAPIQFFDQRQRVLEASGRDAAALSVRP